MIKTTTEDGILYRSWRVKEGRVERALIIATILKDLDQPFLWLNQKDDLERLNHGEAEPAENIIAIGPNDDRYTNALLAFARRHGVKRVYQIMPEEEMFG